MERGVFRGHLDDEQRIVFAHVLNGKSGREIAAIMCLKPARVEQIVRKTCRQLDADGRKHAARIIANHGVNPPYPHHSGPSQTTLSINHNGSDSLGIRAKTTQTKSDHQTDGVYVHDVANSGSSNDRYGNILDEIAGMFSNSKSSSELTYAQRIFLIVIVIMCSTMSLSALIATLQGFDKLMGS